MTKIKYILFLSYFLFLGCSYKTTPIYAVIKTPFFKVSDAGFLEEGINYKRLIIYKNGNIPIEVIVYKDKVCINKSCVSKYIFIKNLSSDYPKNLLDLILNKQKIKNLGKITKIKNGFLQKNSRFFYLVKKNEILFKDKMKKITIMIKEIQ